MGRMGGRMGNRQSESLADKRRRRERMAELDDCSTLCFPQKKISNMEAKDEAKGPQGPQGSQLQGPQRQSMGKTDECADLGQLVIGTVWCVLTFCK